MLLFMGISGYLFYFEILKCTNLIKAMGDFLMFLVL